MKISTGLRPRVDQPTTYPKIDRPDYRMVVDEAPVIIPAMRTLDLWPVIFETAVDTDERPEGTIMSVVQFTRRPKVTHRTIDLDLWDDFKEHAEQMVAHNMERHNAPADAVILRTPIDGAYGRGEHYHAAWYEVEA